MTAVAPAAPGKLGVPLAAQDAMRYLGTLGDWVAERRRELDALDAAILASPARDSFTSDIVLSLSLWQAAKARYDLLLATWDSGRVGPAQLERLSALVWGHLDDTLPDSGSPTTQSAALSGLSVSLPEACRLSDALAGQLRLRLNLDPASDQVAARIRDLRAQLERLRDQVALEPPVSREQATGKLSALASRTIDVAAKAERGGDVGGLLGPLEIEAATFERDLIVGNTKRRQAHDQLERARELADALTLREKALEDLVTRTIKTTSSAPKYAVPRVSALGPLPNTPAALEAYLGRLSQVSNAMQIVQTAYGKALDDHAALVADLAAARAEGGTGDPDLDALGALAQRFCDRKPAPADLVRRLLDAYALGRKALETTQGVRK